LHLGYHYRIHSDGALELKLTGKVKKVGEVYPDILPRIGIVMEVPGDRKQVTWYGRGFEENYCDSRTASYRGIYQACVEQLHTDYVFPQENGHREQVKWLSMSNQENSLMIKAAKPVGMNIHDYTTEELEKATHMGTIQKNDNIIVNIDYRQSGLGSNSCGQDQLEPYRVTLEDFSMHLEFDQIKSGDEVKESKKLYF